MLVLCGQPVFSRQWQGIPRARVKTDWGESQEVTEAPPIQIKQSLLVPSWQWGKASLGRPPKRGWERRTELVASPMWWAGVSLIPDIPPAIWSAVLKGRPRYPRVSESQTRPWLHGSSAVASEKKSNLPGATGRALQYSPGSQASLGSLLCRIDICPGKSKHMNMEGSEADCHTSGFRFLSSSSLSVPHRGGGLISPWAVSATSNPYSQGWDFSMAGSPGAQQVGAAGSLWSDRGEGTRESFGRRAGVWFLHQNRSNHPRHGRVLPFPVQPGCGGEMLCLFVCSQRQHTCPLMTAALSPWQLRWGVSFWDYAIEHLPPAE